MACLLYVGVGVFSLTLSRLLFVCAFWRYAFGSQAEVRARESPVADLVSKASVPPLPTLEGLAAPHSQGTGINIAGRPQPTPTPAPAPPCAFVSTKDCLSGGAKRLLFERVWAEVCLDDLLVTQTQPQMQGPAQGHAQTAAAGRNGGSAAWAVGGGLLTARDKERLKVRCVGCISFAAFIASIMNFFGGCTVVATHFKPLY